MPTSVRASTPSSSRRKATKKKAKKKVAKKKVAKKKATKKVARVTKKTTGKSAPKKGKKDPAKPKAAKPKDKLTHVSAIRCHNCYEIVYSRTSDDNRACGCGLLVVTGGPEQARIASRIGSGTPLMYPLAVTRAKLQKDISAWNSQYGRVPYPRVRFRHFVRNLLPIQWTVDQNSFRLDFVPPRSTPERAPRVEDANGSIVWMDGPDIYGKVQLRVVGLPNLRPTTALVRLGDLPRLARGVLSAAVHDWRYAHMDALREVTHLNPQWGKQLPAVKDVFFPDVLALKSKTQSGMHRALMTRRRLGKFL